MKYIRTEAVPRVKMAQEEALAEMPLDGQKGVQFSGGFGLEAASSARLGAGVNFADQRRIVAELDALQAEVDALKRLRTISSWVMAANS